MEQQQQIRDHLDKIKAVTPSSDGCKECLETGDTWMRLRECLECGPRRLLLRFVEKHVRDQAFPPN